MTDAVLYGERMITAGRALAGPRVVLNPSDGTQGGSGQFQITGTIDEMGAPGAYRVRAYYRDSGRLAREVWSNPDGAFTVTGLPYLPSGYFVTGHDHSDPLRNAAISDYLTPEPMPT